MTTSEVTWAPSELPWVVKTMTEAQDARREDGIADDQRANAMLARYQDRLNALKAQGQAPVDHEAQQVEPTRPASTGQGTGRRQPTPASPKMKAFVKDLLARKVLKAVGPTIPADIDAISYQQARDLIDYLLTCEDKAQAQSQVRPATDPMKGLVAKLARERGREIDTAELSFTEARALIDGMLAEPKQAQAELTVGIYRVGDKIFKVYPNQSKTHLLAKLLILPEGWMEMTREEREASAAQPEWLYQGMAARFAKADQKLSMEDAKQFGKITSVCCQCGRMLTDEVSIENGIGPWCASKGGW